MESNFKLKVHQLTNGIVFSSIKEIKEEIKHEQIKLDIPELPKVEATKQKKGRKKKDV